MVMASAGGGDGGKEQEEKDEEELEEVVARVSSHWSAHQIPSHGIVKFLK